MSLQESNARKPDISLSLRTVADDLVADGRLSSVDSEQLSLKTRRKEQLSWNPVELIAEEMMAAIRMVLLEARKHQREAARLRATAC